MTARNTAAVILAAGKGVRMKSALPKVMHEMCGEPLLGYVIKAAKDAGAEESRGRAPVVQDPWTTDPLASE